MISKPSAIRYATVLLLLATFSIFISPEGNANETSCSNYVVTNEKELIIQVHGLSVKNTAELRKTIEDNAGVTFRGICYQNSVLMYVIDRDLQPDNAFIDDAMRPLNLTYVVKEGTILQVIAACTDEETQQTTETE